MDPILKSYSLCAKVPDDDTAEELAAQILAQFELKPYDHHMVTWVF